MRDLGSMYEVKGSNLIATDIPKKDYSIKFLYKN